MAARVNVLQGGVPGVRRHRTAPAGVFVHNGEVDALGGGNGHQLFAEAVTDGFHVDAVAVAAHTGSQNGLGQVVADVEPEFAPHLLPDVLGGAEMNARALKQGRDGLYPLTFKGCGQLAVNDAQCGVRVKAEAVRFLVGDHLDERVEQVIRSYLGRNIAAEVGADHLLYSLIKVVSHKEADGFRFDPDTTLGIIYGELAAPFESERVQAVAALFEGTGVHFRATEHIREEMWSKFRLNVCNNLPQAILGAGVGCYRDSVHMKAISDGLRKELMAIAAAKGIDLSIVDKNSGRGSAVPPDARYSTLQDIDAGRHTEIDMFSGALMRMGKELGIPTPYNEYTYHMIKALEEKNDGLFDYSGKDQEPTWAK